MALLHLVRDRGVRLTGDPPVRRERTRRAGTFFLAAVFFTTIACGSPDAEHIPDDVLKRELGLTDQDRVHTVVVTRGETEVATPAVDTIPVGAWLQFVSGDWLVHEVAFDSDGLDPAASSFLERTGQMASPPLLQRDARFVVSLEGAPPGRYPYTLEGNGAPGRGLVVVVDPKVR